MINDTKAVTLPQDAPPKYEVSKDDQLPTVKNLERLNAVLSIFRQLLPYSLTSASLSVLGGGEVEYRFTCEPKNREAYARQFNGIFGQYLSINPSSVLQLSYFQHTAALQLQETALLDDSNKLMALVAHLIVENHRLKDAVELDLSHLSQYFSANQCAYLDALRDLYADQTAVPVDAASTEQTLFLKWGKEKNPAVQRCYQSAWDLVQAFQPDSTNENTLDTYIQQFVFHRQLRSVSQQAVSKAKALSAEEATKVQSTLQALFYLLKNWFNHRVLGRPVEEKRIETLSALAANSILCRSDMSRQTTVHNAICPPSYTVACA